MKKNEKEDPEEEINRMRDQGFVLLKAIEDLLDEHDPKTRDVLMVMAFLACRAAYKLGMPLEKFLLLMATSHDKVFKLERAEEAGESDDEDDGFFPTNRRNR